MSVMISKTLYDIDIEFDEDDFNAYLDDMNPHEQLELAVSILHDSGNSRKLDQLVAGHLENKTPRDLADYIKNAAEAIEDVVGGCVICDNEGGP